MLHRHTKFGRFCLGLHVTRHDKVNPWQSPWSELFFFFQKESPMTLFSSVIQFCIFYQIWSVTERSFQSWGDYATQGTSSHRCEFLAKKDKVTASHNLWVTRAEKKETIWLHFWSWLHFCHHVAFASLFSSMESITHFHHRHLLPHNVYNHNL